MQRFSPEELTRKHLSTKITAKDRARDFLSDLYEDGSQSFRFKTLVLTFRAVNGAAPDYIKSLLQPYTPTRHLRSSSDNRLVVPPLKTGRSQHKLFSCLAPQWWNQLPTSIRDSDCLPTFKNRLKTHLFREYNGT